MILRLLPIFGVVVLALWPELPVQAAAESVTLHVDPSTVLAHVPADFLGFGYESAAVAQPQFFSPENHALVQLYRTVSPHGVVRIGGNVSDHTRYEPDGEAAPRNEREVTVINRANLASLGAFLRATGWQAIWTVNLGTGSAEEAAQEATAVAQALGDRLYCFEIGNEVDLLPRFHHDYAAFATAYREYRFAISAAVPSARFSGPDTAGATDWCVRFAQTEGAGLRLLTKHYYRSGASLPNATIETLLDGDPKWQKETLDALQAACTGKPFGYRLTEVNSFYGGGKAGVSDTFASALWCLDYLLDCAAHGCAGVNLETDVNHLGWVSHYSPIFRQADGTLTARPEYYGMLAFALPGNSGGDLLQLTADVPPALNLTAHALKNTAGELWITILNKDAVADARVSVPLPAGYESVQTALVYRLSAPSLTSKEDVTLAGATVMPDGRWNPGTPESVRSENGGLSLLLPHGSAVVLRLQP